MNPPIGIVNNRQILYFDRAQFSNLSSWIPKSDWMLFAIADPEQEHLLEQLAKTCLNNGVLYVCGAGKAGSSIDNTFDFEIVDRKIEKGEDDYSDTPMTTWHEDLAEGFWYATTVASHDTLIIDTIVCINLTEHDYKSQLENLIDRINTGWLPED